MADEPSENAGEDGAIPRAAGVLAATDAQVPIDVHQIDDDRVPDGMLCLGTFLDGQLVARCAIPPEAMEFLATHQLFAHPRQLVLAAREEEPGLRCELYAIVPVVHDGSPGEEGEPEEPWAASVPISEYERDVEGKGGSAAGREAEVAAILLGQIVRFQKDRKHPESLQLEAIDVLARIVSGRVVEVVDKVLEDLLGR